MKAIVLHGSPRKNGNSDNQKTSVTLERKENYLFPLAMIKGRGTLPSKI